MLLDSLLAVFIVICMCALCMSIFKLNVRYEEGYENYQERTGDSLVQIFNQLYPCEACEDESD